MFSFPPTKETCEKWEANLKIKASPKLKICRIHFEDECLGKKKLKLNSVPTLFLGKFFLLLRILSIFNTFGNLIF